MAAPQGYPLPSRCGGWQRPGMGMKPQSSRAGQGGNSWSPNPRCLRTPRPLSVSLVLEWERLWEGTFPLCHPGEPPEVPQLLGHVNSRGRRGWDTPERMGGQQWGDGVGGHPMVGSAGCRGVLGTGGIWGRGHWNVLDPKVLSQHLAPEVGEEPEPPRVRLGGTWGPPRSIWGPRSGWEIPAGCRSRGGFWLSSGGPAKLLPPAGPPGWLWRGAVTVGSWNVQECSNTVDERVKKFTLW